MTEQPAPTWEAPAEPVGPAPGVAYAPHGERLIAYIIDGFIVGVFVVLATLIAILVLGSGVSGSGQDATVSAGAAGGFTLIMLVVIVLATAYFPWFWWRGGATPGMKRFHLRVVRDRDGGPISGGQAVLRFIGQWVSSVVFYLGFAWILIDARRRGWHDLIAGTVVVKEG